MHSKRAYVIAQTNVWRDEYADASRLADQEYLPEAKQAASWTQLAAEYGNATEFLKAKDAYDRLLHLLKTAPSARAQYAATLDALASLYLSYGRAGDAESVGKQALTVRQKLGNLSDIAVSQV